MHTEILAGVSMLGFCSRALTLVLCGCIVLPHGGGSSHHEQVSPELQGSVRHQQDFQGLERTPSRVPAQDWMGRKENEEENWVHLMYSWTKNDL